MIVEIRKPFFNTIYVKFMKKHPKMKSVLKKSLNLFPMICEFALRNCFELFCNISSVWLQLAKANSMSGKLVLRKRKLGLLLNTHLPILPIAVCLSTMIHIHTREFLFNLIQFYCFVLNTHSPILPIAVCLSMMIHAWVPI